MLQSHLPDYCKLISWQRLYRVDGDKKLDLLDELELDKGEDAPMSMDAHPQNKEFVCGVNSSVERLKEAENENCRMYGVKDNKYVFA